MKRKFNKLTASGTFDRLHSGHKFFLLRAFQLGDEVAVGVTSDKFVKNKLFSTNIESFKERKNNVVSFLQKKGFLIRANIFKLHDIYGPAFRKNSKIQAILVTQKTIENAKKINEKRKKLNLPPLKIVKVKLIKAGNNEIISSTNKRNKNLFSKTLVLPQSLRPTLSKPLGPLLKGKEENLKLAVLRAKELIRNKRPLQLITVGDVVTKSFNEANFAPDIAIVDFRIKREEKIKNLRELGFKKEKPDLTVENPAGRITSSLSGGIRKAIRHLGGGRIDSPEVEGHVIRVLGEEDLAVLPAIVLSLDNTAIFYGQPPNRKGSRQAGEGIVVILVDEKVRNETLSLLSKFT